MRCAQTTFVLAGRQIHIHTSNRCDVYVHAASHPILEHCREFRRAHGFTAMNDGERTLSYREMDAT